MVAGAVGCALPVGVGDAACCGWWLNDQTATPTATRTSTTTTLIMARMAVERSPGGRLPPPWERMAVPGGGYGFVDPADG